MEGEMYKRIAAVVILVLVPFVVIKATSVPIGTISSCKGAAIHGANLVPGTTIFSGDTIDVGAQGNAWIAVRGGGQVQVSENSTVLLTKSPDSIRVTVDHGQAQTNIKGVVINRNSLEDDRSQTEGKDDHDKHKERDCEVSKASRKFKPCRDDSD
jgi:hypothetical protein